jgi:hypothetical protein
MAVHHDEPAGQVQAPPRNGFWAANRVSLVAVAITIALTVMVRFGLPHERELTSVWVLLGKLTPFLAATVAIAWLDRDWGRRLRLHLIAIPAVFVVFFCWFVPNIFVAALRMPEQAAFDELYLHALVMVPFVILGLLLAYRLGGGSREAVLRLAAAMLLIQLSGLEDLVAVALQGDIPEVWGWATHITVFLGHPASRTEAYVFIAVHLVLAVLVLTVPLRGRSRWSR